LALSKSLARSLSNSLMRSIELSAIEPSCHL
jgi:hypothetical protein